MLTIGSEVILFLRVLGCSDNTFGHAWGDFVIFIDDLGQFQKQMLIMHLPR